MADFGLIVGSGVLDWDIGWTALDNRETAFGSASSNLQVAHLGDHRIFALTRHGVPHRYAPHAVNYRANLSLLAEQQVAAIVALNTVGGISQEADSGTLLLPDQIIDYSWGRIQSFSPIDEVRHIDFSEPYDGPLRERLMQAADRADIALHDGGVMGVTQGPRLETAAEIRRMSRDGCSMVGMTGMPEAVLARELDIPFAALAMVVNPAAGLAAQTIDLNEIRAVSRNCMRKASALLGVFFQTVEDFD